MKMGVEYTPAGVPAAFGPGHEEGESANLMQFPRPCKGQITATRPVRGIRLDRQDGECVDIARLAAAGLEKGGNSVALKPMQRSLA